MYHCHIRFYLTGGQHGIFDIIKKMSPLEHFTHEFYESGTPETPLAVSADVIFADLTGKDARAALQFLVSAKRKDARLILLADKDQIASLSDSFNKIDDIWVLPLSDSELSFRFLKWQQAYKRDKDHWQDSQYLEAAINSVPNLVWYKDKNGIHHKVNDSFCKTVNKTKQQVEGQRHAYIWDVEQDDPACIESEHEVMSTRKTCISEETVKTGDGTKLLTTYKSPLYDIDGSVMGTVGVAIDITQERAYEQELIKKNLTLETIFTSLDCGIMTHSLDGKHIISINRAALNILGYSSKKELMEKGFDLVAPSVVEEDKPKLREAIKKLDKPDDTVNVEYRIQHDNGQILHIMGNIKLLEEDGTLFYQRFLLDCTDQKLKEKRERMESERRQMELVHALSVDFQLVCFFDLNTGMGNLLQLTDNSRYKFDYIFNNEISLDAFMELFINRTVYESDKEMLRNASSIAYIKNELTEKKLYYVNFRIARDKNIEYFQMKVVRAGNWAENKGIVLGFCSVDEETRKEMEQKNLLKDALHQAKRASRAKSVFLSNMSHDIRTPMNAIVGFTNLAVTHIDNKEQVEEYLGKIMTSGNHLLSLINDVLDMSRIESGKIHLEEKPCSLPDILHGLHNIIQADVHAKQLELYIDTIDVFDEDIYCDKLRLNQVLLNLLSNSIKYTAAGGSVSMRITEKPGAPSGYANFEFIIKDSGIGMSEEFVSHIFEPFEREQNTTTSGIQGTGLGMAITKNIVDMMNGTIEVKSEQGIGTEFIVSFTFRLFAEEKKPKDIKELKGCRALVVDDDFNTCDSVSYMLGQIGMSAEWTLSGKEAVLRTHQAVMRGNDYRVYIVDWLLPDMNGVEVARRIKKETGGNVPIIVLTAYDWSDIEAEAKEAGVTAFCSKPLFLSELSSCLKSIINKDKNETEEDSSGNKHHTGRILLAEDVDLNQEIACTLLNESGFSTEVAGNGKIALEMVSKSEPGYYQVVLMDIQMPVMNGYEATKAIRKLENKELASIPIIAMTANAFEEDKQEALRSGMNGHIPKPIDIDNLFSTLDRILK